MQAAAAAAAAATQQQSSVAAVLSQDTQLRGYAAAFEAAEIDLELAGAMRSAELRELLPGSPLGHRLRLSRVLGQAAASRVTVAGSQQRGSGKEQGDRLRLPADPAWYVHGRILGAGVANGDFLSACIMQMVRSCAPYLVIVNSHRRAAARSGI
eukprot:COSAG01_NODE_4231_length_5222_cov_25.632832_4_plen_154_part_00